MADRNQILFSILIPSIPERRRKFSRLVAGLERQAVGRDDVEIIGLVDNRSREIADKRNALLDLARGRFLSFIDDDDGVDPSYLSRILEAIEEHPDADVITFHQRVRINGRAGRIFCGVSYPKEPLKKAGFFRYRDARRPPFHWCVWRRELAVSEPFRAVYGEDNRQSAEDYDWLLRLYPKIQRSHAIDAFLHDYRFDSWATRSRDPDSGGSCWRARVLTWLRNCLPHA